MSVNKAILIGNLGADPEVRNLPSGATVASCSVATTRRWTDKQTGEKREQTEWHRVIFFNRLAEIAGEYLKKGSKVYVEGRLQTRKWEKDGQDHYTTEIIGEVMHMLGGREENAATGNFDGKNERPPSASRNNASAPPSGDDDFDDDIPF